MTTSYIAENNDQLLTHRFIRLFGHRPTAQELEHYQRARASLSGHLPARIRRHAARLVTRL
jgi:hypothetical protein